MTEREELDFLIRQASNGGDYGPNQLIDCVSVEDAVEAILAAGYRKQKSADHREYHSAGREGA